MEKLDTNGNIIVNKDKWSNIVRDYVKEQSKTIIQNTLEYLNELSLRGAFDNAYFFYFAGSREVGLSKSIEGSDIDVSRSSTAYEYDAYRKLNEIGNNFPQMEFDPVNGAFLGITALLQQENHNNYSSDVNSWSNKTNITVESLPDYEGFESPVKITENASASISHYSASTSAGLSSDTTLEIHRTYFIKDISARYVCLLSRATVETTLSEYVMVDLEEGRIIYSHPRYTSTSIRKIKDYYEIKTVTSGQSSSSRRTISVAFGSPNGSSIEYISGSGGREFILLGTMYQVYENGLKEASYIYTNGSKVTRSKDTISSDVEVPMDNVTFFADFTWYNSKTNDNLDYVLALLDNSSKGIVLRLNSSGKLFVSINNGSTRIVELTSNNEELYFIDGDSIRLGFSIKQGEYSLIINGKKYNVFGVGSQSTANPLTTSNKLFFGSTNVSVSLKAISVLPFKNDTELEILTRNKARELKDPETFYLTYSGVPSTTIDIMYFSNYEHNRIYYKKESDNNWSSGFSTKESYPYDTQPIPSRKYVHRVVLSGLTPDTGYDFKFTEKGKVYKFKTTDVNPTNYKVVFTGDVSRNKESSSMFNAVRNENPNLLVIGGDWAYADGLEVNSIRWTQLWYMFMRLVDSSEYIIPIIAGIGNHEVIGGYNGTIPDDAIYFYRFFPQMKKGFRTFDVSSLLSLIVLDSEHTAPTITGTDEQTLWLNNVLNQRSSVKHVIPCYHVPAYPASRPYTGELSVRLREHWIPLFENSNVKAVFEHHDHVYKRTIPILNGEENEDGIVYFGDGCFGVAVRDCMNPDTTWYLDVSYGNEYIEGLSGAGGLDGQPAYPEKARHFYLVDFTTTKRTIKSIDINNNVIETIEQDV